ncbi:hypothetical protein LX36DRAFT_416661 [Colletotrichum falcatum]|nr:hypothetical protein LX36DRAFT_416661 [Colletotrichum falcatum]
MEAAASAIAFVQLTASIANLVRLYRGIHDIPEDLQDTLEHLDLVRPVLCQIKIDFERYPDLASLSGAKQCVEHAIAAAAKVNTLAKRLHDRIEKGRRGNKRFGVRGHVWLLRANFREDEIEKLQKRLERAVGLVGLCVECYRLAVDQISGDRIIKDTSSMVLSRTQTLVEESEARIIRRVTLELASHQKGEPRLAASNETAVSKGKTQTVGSAVTKWRDQGFRLDSYAPSPLGRVVVGSSKATGRRQVTLQTPSWLSREAWTWEFQSQRAVSGWNFSLRSYSIRPQDSLIFKVVKSGDVSTMLALFGTGEASLYDRDAGGSSLFHYAAQYNQVDLCRKLLELGLTATIDERPSGKKRSPLEELVYDHTHGSPHNPDRRLLDLLLNHRAEIASISTRKLFDFLGGWVVEDDYLRSFQQWFMPEYHRLPLLERAEAARRACFSAIQSANTVFFLLGGHEADYISAENVGECARLGFSVVHSAAVALGWRRAADLAPDMTCLKANVLNNKYNMNWGGLVYFAVAPAEDGVLHGVEVVEPSYDFGTAPWEGPPLASVLGGAICWLRSTRRANHDFWDRVLQDVVRKWARELVDFGTDLASYGNKEKAVFYAAGTRGTFDADSLSRNESCIRNNCSSAARDAMPMRVTALDVGSDPSDWRIWWAPEYEVLARQFWDVLDNPPEVMPGSWFD